MPLKAKVRLLGPKRRRTAKASSAEVPIAPGDGMPTPSDVDVDEGMEEAQGESEGRCAAARLETYARLAWWSDYMPLLKMECEENGAVHAVPEHVSSYRHKQLRKSAAEDAFWKSALRIYCASRVTMSGCCARRT